MNKYAKESLFKVLMIVSVLIIAASLLLILGICIVKGGYVILKDPKLIVTAPGPKYLLGGEGGLLHAILGSIYMVIPSTIIATFLAYLIARFLQVDYIRQKWSDRIRVLFDVLWGVPSIIFGIFVLNVLIRIGGRGCLLAAIITLALLQLPIIVRYMDEALSAVPNGIRESMYSLGATRLETSHVIAKYALPGITAGVLLGMGRAIGDAASVVFTAGASNALPTGLLKSASSLPLLIFMQASSYYPSVRDHAYAASFMLIAIILLLNICSRASAKRFRRFTNGGKNL